MEKTMMSYEEFCDPAYRRREQMKVKSEAVWVAFHELDGLLNVSKFARRFFGKSQSWFVQKLQGLTVCGKQRGFTEEECARLSSSLRELARDLEAYADAIEKARFECG